MEKRYISAYNYFYNMCFFIGQFFVILFLLSKVSKEFLVFSAFIPKFLFVISLFIVIVSVFIFGIQKEKILIYILLLLLILSYLSIKIVKPLEYIGYDWTPIYFCSFYIGFSKTNVSFFSKEYIFKNILFMVVIIMGLSGIISNEPFYRWKDDTARYALGFSSPNTLGVVYLSIVLSTILFIDKFKYKKTIVFLLFLATLLIYYITYSRTSIIVAFIAFFYLFLTKILKKKIYLKRLHIFFLFFSIIFIGVGLPFINKLSDIDFSIINDLLSGRLDMSTHFINKYGLSFLGRSIPENSSLEISYFYFSKIEEWVLDNGYIRILLNQGTLFLTAYLFFLYKRILKITKISNNTDFIVIFVLILLYGIFERYTFNIFIFPQLLLLSYISEDDLLRQTRRKEDII